MKKWVFNYTLWLFPDKNTTDRVPPMFSKSGMLLNAIHLVTRQEFFSIRVNQDPAAKGALTKEEVNSIIGESGMLDLLAEEEHELWAAEKRGNGWGRGMTHGMCTTCLSPTMSWILSSRLRTRRMFWGYRSAFLSPAFPLYRTG